EVVSSRIRELHEADAGALRAVRLRALREEEDAFESSYEDEVVLPEEVTAKRLREKAGTDDFALGAFDAASELVGIVHFGRHKKSKARHKADLTSLYVVPEARGAHVGAALLDEVLRRARSLEGLDQVHLSVVTRKAGARRLYASRGFVPWGLSRRGLKI